MGQPLDASNAQVWKTRGRVAVSQSPPALQQWHYVRDVISQTINGLRPLPVVVANNPRVCLQRLEGLLLSFAG